MRSILLFSGPDLSMARVVGDGVDPVNVAGQSAYPGNVFFTISVNGSPEIDAEA